MKSMTKRGKIAFSGGITALVLSVSLLGHGYISKQDEVKLMNNAMVQQEIVNEKLKQDLNITTEKTVQQDGEIKRLNEANKELSEENTSLKESLDGIQKEVDVIKKQLEDYKTENSKLKKDLVSKAEKERADRIALEKKKEKEKATTLVASNVSRSSSEVEGKSFYVSATAYTAYCVGCSGVTATGINLRANPHLKVIAVDPRVIPLGTKVHVEGYGYAISGDTGSAIKGNKIDVFIPDKSQALNWGRKKVKITIIK